MSQGPWKRRRHGWIAAAALALAAVGGCDAPRGGGAGDAPAGDDAVLADVLAMDADPGGDAADVGAETAPDAQVTGDAAEPVDAVDAADALADVPVAPDVGGADAGDTVAPEDAAADTVAPDDTVGPSDTTAPDTSDTAIPDAGPADTGGGAPDVAPPCDDGDRDGVCDDDDRCRGYPDGADADHDQLPDGCDPCPASADHTDTDTDGIPDACDRCPLVPRTLVYGVNSDHDFGAAALDLLDCEHTVAGVGDFVALLDSGDFGAVVLDMPDARPEGDWAAALLDFIAGGGAAVLSTWRPDLVPGPNLAATFGASVGGDPGAARAFAPTWVEPVFTAPFDLTGATFSPTSSLAAFHGPALTATAGRVFAVAQDGGAIVQSNGGRTFIDGFLWDDFPADSDGDGAPDVVELIANQLVAASRARLPASGPVAPTVEGWAASGAPLRHDLPILRGVADADATSVVVRVGRDKRAWPVSDRRVKALLPLVAGQNYVSVTDRGATTYLTVRHTPQTNPNQVRLVIALASDGDGTFDAPPGEPHDLASAKRRIQLGGRLVQTMIADRLDALGLGARTFRLKTDATGAPEVLTWWTSATTAAWYAMTGAEMFSWVWAHQGELPPCDGCRTVVMLGMTHYDAATGRGLAHTALGGGGIALFGTGTLYSWAESLDQLVARLSDDRRVSTLSPPLMDDSGGRGTLWANYATGVGAVLHELGHALNLPHPTDNTAIMNRGFDQVNRLVMVSEPPSNSSGGITAVWPVSEPRFTLVNGGRLRYHRFLAQDATSYTVNAAPAISRVGDEVRVDTAAGVRVVSYAISVTGSGGAPDWRVAGGEVLTTGAAPTHYVIPLGSLRFLFPGQATLHLGITDDQGNLADDFSVQL